MTRFISRRCPIRSCGARRKNWRRPYRTPPRLARSCSNCSKILTGFSLEDYQPFANVNTGFERLVRFLSAAMSEAGRRVKWLDEHTFSITSPDGDREGPFTIDRDRARERDGLELMGLDHPIMLEALRRWQDLDPELLGVAVVGDEGPAVASGWLIRTQGKDGKRRAFVQPLAVSVEGKRVRKLEASGTELLTRGAGRPILGVEERVELLHDTLEPMVHRELNHRGLVPANGGYSSILIGWAEVSPQLV